MFAAAASPRPARRPVSLGPYGIQLVNKNDGRSPAPRRFKELPHAPRALPDEDFDELGARGIQQRNPCLCDDTNRAARLALGGPRRSRGQRKVAEKALCSRVPVATARARAVFPVPGGPTSKTPFGRRAPTRMNFSGVRRHSTTSSSSCLASQRPEARRGHNPSSRQFVADAQGRSHAGRAGVCSHRPSL